MRNCILINKNIFIEIFLDEMNIENTQLWDEMRTYKKILNEMCYLFASKI